VRVAGLTLIAGRRAKTSTAYGSALEHLTAGRALLTEDDWSDNHELIFSIEVLLAECELLTADMVAAENRLSMLMRRARTAHHVAVATRLRVVLYTTLDRNSRAVEAGLEYLRRGGNGWSTHPTNHDVMHEYNRIWSLVGKRKIEDLIDLPLMRDPDLLDVLDALAELVWPAMFCEEALLSLVICRMVNLSLEHGNSDASCFGYVLFAIIAGPRFGDYEAGLSFGQLGYDLIEDRGLKRFQAGTYCSFGYSALPWTRHVRTGRDLVRRAFHAASEIGDVTSAGISVDLLIRSLLLAGDQLAEVQREAESALHFAQKVRFGRVVDHITPQLGLVRTLRGLTPTFGSLDDDQFDEFQFELYLANNAAFAEPECWYWIRKLQARVFAGDYASAVAASLSARCRLATSPSQFLSLDPVETAEYHFYSALANAASCDTALPDQRQKHFEALAAHHDRLASCAENSPENFGNRAALVGAEIARIEGRVLDAEQLYEQAIGSAHSNGFIHIEALANEAAARFYAARGLGKIALMYLSNARACYLQWGADGKVRQLDNLYPDLRHGETFSDSTSTISTSVESLDLATVVRLSQAISGEIVLEKLFDRIMRIAVEHAGAERGLLILPRGDEHRIEAEATTTTDSVKVALRQADVTAEDLPESVLRYVVRTKESITLHDAAGESRFSEDEYIRWHQARSVLCLPLLKQTRLVGVLYLENNLSRHVFTAARIAVLTLLASEAAISLENTRLYADLRERESKVRRLVDSNIIGIFIFDHVPDILEANQSFLKTIGYDREDLKAGRVRWIELTPPEWRDRTAHARAELKATGVAQPFEKEFFRKDGSRVPVLTGGALFDGEEEQGVAFVLDLSERKRAEVEARESERRYREAQMELAHANRVAVMGQLTASIAHEVSQPNTAVVASAHAARHWLDRGPPDLDKVRQALARIERNAVRASEVIGRIRDLIKKTPPRKDRLAINPVIREVIELTQTEAARNGVSVQTAFAEQLPDIVGDRVELQQVAVNLILNAIEAMSGTMQGDRELLVRTARADNGGVLVAVADSGPGLPPAGLEHLFEPFYTTKAGGLGVGLSICRSIIEAHGGLLWVSANAPRGAIFQFIVPVDGGLRIS
jgi:PAS domain S-box-containing protein